MYYDGYTLLNKKDINGEKPEIYICSGNRSSGKTTFFSKWMVNNWMKKKIRKFLLLYRWNYELCDIEEKFFKEIKTLFFPDMEMSSIKKDKGVYFDLLLDKRYCGYATSINYAEQIKKLSHLFADVDVIFMDEFQSENGKYCPNEIEKFMSIHTSIARGGGKQVRYVPVILLSNLNSILNPYYSAMNIGYRLNIDTKFLRGDGFVLEQNYLESVAKDQSSSAFNRAFSNTNYAKTLSEKIYLNDNLTFIEKIKGNGTYICNVKYNQKIFAVRFINGFVYCSKNYDKMFNVNLAINVEDVDESFTLINNNPMLIVSLRKYFENGLMRFDGLESKECIFNLLAYR